MTSMNPVPPLPSDLQRAVDAHNAERLAGQIEACFDDIARSQAHVGAVPFVDDTVPFVHTAPVAPTASNLQVRIAVFETVPKAAKAVQGLLAAGFLKEHISVVCSDRVKESIFSEFEHDRPAGATTASAAGTGAVVGGVAAGLAAVTGVALGVATGGLGLLVLGPLFAGTGAAVGTFVGAMMSRGVEHEVANYYDQAVKAGEILVAAEAEGDPAADLRTCELLERAERVFAEVGARPMALPQG
ncbi:MAG: hypothetical protein K8T90_12240 [Planctomycetes bacterium]|nr:hypothetical protein [Planctomycetota bacterium]